MRWLNAFVAKPNHMTSVKFLPSASPMVSLCLFIVCALFVFISLSSGMNEKYIEFHWIVIVQHGLASFYGFTAQIFASFFLSSCCYFFLFSSAPIDRKMCGCQFIRSKPMAEPELRCVCFDLVDVVEHVNMYSNCTLFIDNHYLAFRKCTLHISKL